MQKTYKKSQIGLAMVHPNHTVFLPLPLFRIYILTPCLFVFILIMYMTESSLQYAWGQDFEPNANQKQMSTPALNQKYTYRPTNNSKPIYAPAHDHQLSIRSDLILRAHNDQIDQAQADRLMQTHSNSHFILNRFDLHLSKQFGDIQTRSARMTRKAWQLNFAMRAHMGAYEFDHSLLNSNPESQADDVLFLRVNQLNVSYLKSWHTKWVVRTQLGYFLPRQSWYHTAIAPLQFDRQHPQWSQQRIAADRSVLGAQLTLFYHQTVDQASLHKKLTPHQTPYQSQWQPNQRQGHQLDAYVFLPRNSEHMEHAMYWGMGFNYQWTRSRFWTALKGFYYYSINPALSSLYQPQLDARLTDEYQSLNFLTISPTYEGSWLGEVVVLDVHYPLVYAWTLSTRSIASADFASNQLDKQQAQRVGDASFALTTALGQSLHTQHQVRWVILPTMQWMLAYQWYDLHLDFAYDTVHQVDLSLYSQWSYGLSTQVVYRHAWNHGAQRWQTQQDEIFFHVSWDMTWF